MKRSVFTCSTSHVVHRSLSGKHIPAYFKQINCVFWYEYVDTCIQVLISKHRRICLKYVGRVCLPGSSVLGRVRGALRLPTQRWGLRGLVIALSDRGHKIGRGTCSCLFHPVKDLLSIDTSATGHASRFFKHFISMNAINYSAGNFSPGREIWDTRNVRYVYQKGSAEVGNAARDHSPGLSKWRAQDAAHRPAACAFINNGPAFGLRLMGV